MTNDQRRHDTAYLNKRLFYKRKVRRLIIITNNYINAVMDVIAYDFDTGEHWCSQCLFKK